MRDLNILEQPLPGIFVLDCQHHLDERGDFTKLFHHDILADQGISFTPAESFLTRSKSGVVRGMHFQVGEAAHDKIVSCIRGRVLDVVVDVRPSSPYFNKPFAIEISEKSSSAVLIGKGYAHGFLALEDQSWMLYLTSTVHSPSLDCGVLWSSIAFDWPIQNPLISKRDSHHPSILELR